jgi:hypothetical protein
MPSDPRREDDTTPDAADVADVYTFLNRASDDLTAELDRVLPVEAAISVTIGPDSPLPKAPPRSRRTRRSRIARRWDRWPSNG